ncbi:alpha/beta hydrolase [Prochlorococcus sp. MIT 1300]|uniref:alpha/beta hydrolase n=1 Tax=Prochlorococcus sp. MIT 1300 TaxID=3096218 RepID=UPI002A756709|nr:alpha/beta hydrolase [Prochlorococcus sp. MIT 1300]
MKIKPSNLIKAIFGAGISLLINCPRGQSAEHIAFMSGAFKRTIPVSDLEYLANTGKTRGLLSDIIRLSNQDPKKIANLLSEKVELKLLVTSRLMHSKIGNVIIGRTTKVIYPSKVSKQSVSIPAIRSAAIKAIYQEQGKINLIDFIKAYPNRVMTVNIPELSKVLGKIESISDLIRFFSNSPLERLKEPKAKA